MVNVQIYFLSYEHQKEPKTEFLAMLPLLERTTAEVQFDMVDDYFKHHNIDWKNCYKVVTDGCPSMMGQRKGFGMLGLSTF